MRLYSRTPKASARIRGCNINRLPTDSPNTTQVTMMATGVSAKAKETSASPCRNIKKLVKALGATRVTRTPPARRPTTEAAATTVTEAAARLSTRSPTSFTCWLSAPT